MQGTIKRLFGSYGFIKVKDSKDLFFHMSQTEGFHELKEGNKVEFELGEGKLKGDKVAVGVEKVE